MDWEELEALYWRFDAMHKGYGEWSGRPTSERDAFKRTVRQALAEKDRESVKWSELIGSFTQSQHRYLVEMERLKQALAEKDMEWKRRVGLDCGGHSCFYAIEKTGMRHNGRCSCDPKRTKQDYDVLYAKYQQLMAQAVLFAENVTRNGRWQEHEWIAAKDFLQSPEVQAWKERQK